MFDVKVLKIIRDSDNEVLKRHGCHDLILYLSLNDIVEIQEEWAEVDKENMPIVPLHLNTLIEDVFEKPEKYFSGIEMENIIWNVIAGLYMARDQSDVEYKDTMVLECINSLLRFIGKEEDQSGKV